MWWKVFEACSQICCACPDDPEEWTSWNHRPWLIVLVLDFCLLFSARSPRLLYIYTHKAHISAHIILISTPPHCLNKNSFNCCWLNIFTTIYLAKFLACPEQSFWWRETLRFSWIYTSAMWHDVGTHNYPAKIKICSLYLTKETLN